MALLLPGGCIRVRPPLSLSRPAHVRRKLTTFATVSPTRGESVDWVQATSSFFEDDTRPIMLFDGKPGSLSYLLLGLKVPVSSSCVMIEHVGQIWFSVTGVCNLCNGGVKFVRDNDRNRLASPLSWELMMFCWSSILLLICVWFSAS